MSAATAVRPGNAPEPLGPLGQRTLDLLWARIRQQGDMPGFAKAISAILGAMRGEDEREFNMTQTVLSDPVLTQKVLRLANSGMYAAFGSSVTTVSRAVMVLGSDAIGHLALGLKLIEELAASSPDTVAAHVEMEKAVLAGMVAQQVAGAADSPLTEQAVVCSMLHSLGRLMLTFYMADYWTRLQQQAGPGHESAAAADVLGLSLEQLGRATAAHWGLPNNLVDAMRSVEPAAPDGETGAVADVSRADWMAGLATMSSLCADALWHDDADGASIVENLVQRYAGMLAVAPADLMGAIDKAKAVAANDLTLAPLSKPAERQARLQASLRQRAENNQLLVSGIADLREAVKTAGPSQMVAMAMEIVFNGLDCSRAVAFVRNRKEHKYQARMGLGDGVNATKDLLPLLQFDDQYEPNVFHAALSSDRVIFIDNAREPKFATKLPAWWSGTLTGASSFVILPLGANGQPAGFLYADWDDSVPPVKLTQVEFGLLNDIRTLVVKAIEIRHQMEMLANKAA